MRAKEVAMKMSLEPIKERLPWATKVGFLGYNNDGNLLTFKENKYVAWLYAINGSIGDPKTKYYYSNLSLKNPKRRFDANEIVKEVQEELDIAISNLEAEYKKSEI